MLSIVIILAVALMLTVFLLCAIVFIQYKSLDETNKRLLFFTESSIQSKNSTYEEYIDVLHKYAENATNVVDTASRNMFNESKEEEETEENDETYFDPHSYTPENFEG